MLLKEKLGREGGRVCSFKLLGSGELTTTGTLLTVSFQVSCMLHPLRAS